MGALKVARAGTQSLDFAFEAFQARFEQEFGSAL